VFSDLLQIDTLELSKVPDVGDGTDLWKWMRFIGSRTEQELHMAAQLDPKIAEAANVALRWTADDQFRFEMEMLEKAERDYYSGLNQAHKQGHAEGLEQGLEQGKAEGLKEGLAEAAAKMLAHGMPAQQVADITGLPLAQVEGSSG
jgi:predicted transposase/invertase (TIGR01784 family)